MKNEMKVTYFHIPQDSLDNAILAWWISRPEIAKNNTVSNSPTVDLMIETIKSYRDRRQTDLTYNTWLEEVLKMDLPIREFVPIFMTIENAPRAFVDQLDRHRVGFAFWEQSFRTLDLDRMYDDEMFFEPEFPKDSIQMGGMRIYHDALISIQTAYKSLVKDCGWPREMARGIIPLHCNTSLSVMMNLRSVPVLISKRSCFLAQGDYWRPILQGIVAGLKANLPESVVDTLTVLPCQKAGRCPYEADELGLLDPNKTMPLCPLFIRNYWPEGKSDLTKDGALNLMRQRYTNYDKLHTDFLKVFGDLKSTKKE